jgi:hypothetical protein
VDSCTAPGFVEGLLTYWTVGVEGRFFVSRHEVRFVFEPDMPSQTGAVDKYFTTVCALLRHVVVFALLVPV